MEDLDNAMDVMNSMEEKNRSNTSPGSDQNRVLIGKVEHFFDKINVVAIKLSGELKIGDVIEIGSEEEAVRQKVTSMQINRKDIIRASAGDDVGIKVSHRVANGSNVYRIES